MKDFLLWAPNRESPTQLTYKLYKKGLFSEFRTTVTAHVPIAVASGLSLDLNNCYLRLSDPPTPDMQVDIRMNHGVIELAEAWSPYLAKMRLHDSQIIRPLERAAPPPPVDCCQ
jgi:hypothetical protein